MPQESNHDEEGNKSVKKAGAVLKNSSWGKFTFICQIKRVEIIVVKFEKTHIQLNLSTKATLGQKKVAVVERF